MGLRESLGPSGAKCGALGAQSGDAPPDLQVVIDAWPTLSERVKGKIMGLVETAGRPTG